MVPSQAELEALAAQVGGDLAGLGHWLATAESCSGGWIAQAITAIAGSSGWFDRGYVTYSNRAKIDLLGVSPATLEAHGAVSEAVAREMARGARERAGVDWSVAVSGIAGPGGGSADKPVGMVCFAWASPTGMVDSTTRIFPGDRQAVRAATVAHALAGLKTRLEGFTLQA